MSTIFGENRDIFFPKLSESLHLITFSDIAVRYLKNTGYEPYLCESGEEARELVHTLPEKGQMALPFHTKCLTEKKILKSFLPRTKYSIWNVSKVWALSKTRRCMMKN